jgi:hypothetical protein
MPLFDTQVESIGTRPRNNAEPIFDYFNRTARQDVLAIKNVLEQWFEQFPENGKADVRGRFRSDDLGNRSAFFELYLNELMARLDYGVEVHPDIQEPTHPDFLLRRGAVPEFYLEAKITTDSKEKAGQQRRMDQVYDSLNRLRSPDFFLALRIRGAPATPPPGARLRADLERWIGTLNWDEVRRLWDVGGFEALPSHSWEHEGWSLLIQPVPKSNESRGSADVRPIGLTMPLTVSVVTSDEDVKDAVEEKSKYGNLRLPLVVAINISSDFCSRYDVINGLFGHETIIFGPRGTAPGGRLHDGAWDGPNGPRNSEVSAVIVYRQLEAWNMKEREPWFIHNPWALNALSPNSLPFSQYIPNHRAGSLDRIEGRSPGLYLNLPDPWPPEE